MKTLQSALQNAEFSITASLSLDGQTSVDEALDQADVLAGHVDAIQLMEDPGSPGQVSCVALAALLLRRGIDPVTSLGCRDRNRIALQSELLGMRALGVSSFILDNDEQIPQEFDARPVFDHSCLELLAMAKAIDEEENWPDKEHEFIIGTRTVVSEDPSGQDAAELLALAGAGARFLQIQPCSSLDLLCSYMQWLVEARVTWSFSVIVSLARVPEAGLLREVASIPGVSGVNLPVLGNPMAVVESIEA